MADNPLHYPELWQLEDEVLELYPVASTDTVSDRMELYIRLAVLKNIPQEDLKVRLMLPERENPYDNDTFYDYTGSQLDYLCNSGFYLAQALELSEKIYEALCLSDRFGHDEVGNHARRCRSHVEGGHRHARGQ